jgi:hypothetical protein
MPLVRHAQQDKQQEVLLLQRRPELNSYWQIIESIFRKLVKFV